MNQLELAFAALWSAATYVGIDDIGEDSNRLRWTVSGLNYSWHLTDAGVTNMTTNQMMARALVGGLKMMYDLGMLSPDA